jgi:DNA-binding NarL/FixJ family response regulator
MSGLACILTMQNVDEQAAAYFGAAQVLMGRVGGSLLPSELMTHQETEAELQARMPAAAWREAFALGQAAPDRIVEQALADAAHATPPGSVAPPPKLTRIQTSIVQDLVQGYDVSRIAQRRGRSLSATYEAIDRILVKLGLTEREAIAPYAVKIGLVKAPNARPGFNPQK